MTAYWFVAVLCLLSAWWTMCLVVGGACLLSDEKAGKGLFREWVCYSVKAAVGWHAVYLLWPQ